MLPWHSRIQRDRNCISLNLALVGLTRRKPCCNTDLHWQGTYIADAHICFEYRLAFFPSNFSK